LGGRESIRESLLNDYAQEAIYDITADIEDAMIEGLTLEEISEQVGVPLSAYDFIDRSGTTQDGITMSGFTVIPGVASDDTILRTLFTSDLLRAKALELTQRARDGETLDALQASVGEGANLTETLLVRTNPPQTLGPQVIVGLFNANEGYSRQPRWFSWHLS